MRSALAVKIYLLKHDLKKQRDRLRMWVVWRMPKWVILWASVRMIAHATQGEFDNTIVPDLSAMTALKRWDSA